MGIIIKGDDVGAVFMFTVRGYGYGDRAQPDLDGEWWNEASPVQQLLLDGNGLRSTPFYRTVKENFK